VPAMRYYKYLDEDGPIGDGYTFVETDDGWAIRQITVHNDNFLASNVRYSPWGLCLADQKVDYDELIDYDEMSPIPITKNEFDEVWNLHLTQRRAIWNKVKKAYKIGSKVEGAILIFFPQGVIVDLGEDSLGVADYVECKASTKPESMYPKHKLTATVGGYDEVNQWIILESPQVHDATIDDE
jgi:hypothetical protein